MKHSPLRLSIFIVTLIAAWSFAEGPALPEASAQNTARSAPAPERRTSRTTTTTSERRVRNVRPNPNAPRGRNDRRARDNRGGDRYRDQRGWNGRNQRDYRPPHRAALPRNRHYRPRHDVYYG